MTSQVHPFMHHHQRWSEALSNLPHAHVHAQKAAVEHVRSRVHEAARAAGLDTRAVSVSWAEGRPQLDIADGPVADAEYGTLEASPNPVLRTAASKAERDAIGLYHTTLRSRLGI